VHCVTEEEIYRLALDTVRSSFGWSYASVWRVDAEGLLSFVRQSGHVNSEFARITMTSRFAEGVGLSGRAWSTGKPFFVADLADLDDCVRAPIAREAGVHSGICLPITVDGRVIATMDFFAMTRLVLAPSRLAALTTVAELVGQTLSRIQANRRFRAELSEMAVRDALTGLHNRRHLASAIDHELTTARASARSIAVIMVDIDFFKSVNDRFGHAVGDEMLQAIASALHSGCRSTDTIARYGGEEFVIVMPGIDIAKATDRAEALRTLCETTVLATPAGPVSATISAGIAMFPESGTSQGELLEAADQALYRAKATGRNRVCAGV
jgi:diguanylate cyclase (GGDEF)-like protein